MAMSRKRPLSVIIIGWLFIAAGSFGLVYHLNELRQPFHNDLGWVLLLRLMAIVGGVFMLLGRNWARWLTLIWLAYHVVLSAFHSRSELVMHSLLLVVIAYFLFRPKAVEYFRGSKVEPA
jgi:hypothetical protein